jgi:hypothetical protein
MLKEGNMTAFQKQSSNIPNIDQLPLPPTDHKKENELAANLFKAKSFNNHKTKYIGSHLTD